MFFNRKRNSVMDEPPFLDGLLYESRLEPEVDSERFDRRLLRNIRVTSAKASFQYWSPAIVGASVASMALLALLQMLANSSSMKPIRILNGDAAQKVDSITVDLPEGPAPRLPVVR